MKATTVGSGLHAKVRGTRAGRCRACSKVIHEGEVVWVSKLDTNDFADPMFIVHVACLAHIVDTAPEQDPLPVDPFARFAAVRAEAAADLVAASMLVS